MMGMEKNKRKGSDSSSTSLKIFLLFFFSGTEEVERHIARSRVRCKAAHTNGNATSIQSKSDTQ
jgi:hypothetical protein